MITFGARQPARPHQIRFHLPLTPEASVSPILRHKHHFRFLEKSLAPSGAQGVVTSSFMFCFFAQKLSLLPSHLSPTIPSLSYNPISLLPTHLSLIIPSLSYHSISCLPCRLPPTISCLSYHPISLLPSHLFSNILSPSLLPSHLSPTIPSLLYHLISSFHLIYLLPSYLSPIISSLFYTNIYHH